MAFLLPWHNNIRNNSIVNQMTRGMLRCAQRSIPRASGSIPLQFPLPPCILLSTPACQAPLIVLSYRLRFLQKLLVGPSNRKFAKNDNTTTTNNTIIYLRKHPISDLPFPILKVYIANNSKQCETDELSSQMTPLCNGRKEYSPHALRVDRITIRRWACHHHHELPTA